MTIAGRTVHRIGFGAMRLCGPGVWGEPSDPEAARNVLKEAVAVGVEFIDTADAYGPEVSERQIADALYPYSQSVLIATKGGYTRPSAGRWVPDGRPSHLRTACELSLRRLNLDSIDLYQLHTPDPGVPFEESVGALAELQQEGKIRHVGLSNVSVRQLESARTIAAIVSVQNDYNVGNRESDDVVDACESSGIAFIAYFPLDAGDLANTRGSVARIANKHGVTAAQVALAWLLQRSPAIVPIPGTSSVEHLHENVAAESVQLDADDLAALE